ncbi:methyltransferase domain-containing protein [Gaiella sp.]|uniref:methyltransferase domain-containing protein n=1 Tax=Gaiella sp. TaxID=2663207 RepID=UPI003982EF84
MLRESCAADALLEEARREIVRLTPVEAHERQLAGAMMIDIRSESARERHGVVPGSVHIPRTVLEWRLDSASPWANPHIDIDRAPPILLCDHGWSSSLAASTLRRLGHEGIGDVIGGFEEWSAAGLPVAHVASESLAANELPGMAPPAGAPETRRPSIEQRRHWESTLGERPDRYGVAASEPARATLDSLRQGRAQDLLELGGGQGRDTLFFARAGLAVTSVDFAPVAVATIAEKARAEGIAERVSSVECDVRQPLPFPDQRFDACYSHMLFCMALSESHLHALAKEVWRILRPAGLCIYTARTSVDPDYGRGTSLGGDLYELDGFVVHFFTRDLVERIAAGSATASFELLDVEEFEEGGLPRRLIRVTMRRPV